MAVWSFFIMEHCATNEMHVCSCLYRLVMFIFVYFHSQNGQEQNEWKHGTPHIRAYMHISWLLCDPDINHFMSEAVPIGKFRRVVGRQIFTIGSRSELSVFGRKVLRYRNFSFKKFFAKNFTQKKFLIPIFLTKKYFSYSWSNLMWHVSKNM